MSLCFTFPYSGGRPKHKRASFSGDASSKAGSLLEQAIARAISQAMVNDKIRSGRDSNPRYSF